MDLPLVLSADSSGQPKWHINASYAEYRHEESHQWIDVAQQGVSVQHVSETETGHSELDQGGGGSGSRRATTDVMDSVLPERTRSACKQLDLISGQHECCPVGKEWTCFGQQAKPTHEHMIFFIADGAKSGEL
jgi:hypothetical protein